MNDSARPPIIHNERLKSLIRPDYTYSQIRAIRELLETNGTFEFLPLPNGLFSAVSSNDLGDVSGYQYVWVRDNVHIAHAHLVNGRDDVAVRNVRTLTDYFKKHRNKFDGIISRESDKANPMLRPHVRFDGMTLSEVPQKWAHAQNDALGYYLWLFCTLAVKKLIHVSEDDVELLLLLSRYFQVIRYWEDEDSGHWEEVRKISASSIGTVIAGLTGLQGLLNMRGIAEEYDYVTKLILLGRRSLKKILPAECIQKNKNQYRKYDAALLFLVYPLNILDLSDAANILKAVIKNLEGDYGIRRYLGDSYWCANYKELLKADERTVDFSDSIGLRDKLLQKGEEAQWCIFDPIISAIYGRYYNEAGSNDLLGAQIYYFNRSLGQLTADDSPFGGLRCPEAYYLDHGRYVPNDHVPLLWAQSNLWISLALMEKSLANGKRENSMKR